MACRLVARVLVVAISLAAHPALSATITPGIPGTCQWQLALPLDLASQGIGPGVFAWLMALNCGGMVVLQPVLGPRLQRLDAGRSSPPPRSSWASASG